MTIIFLALLLPDFNNIYAIGVILAAIILVIEHILISGSLKYLKASFFTLNGIFSILFAGLTIADMFIY